MKVLLVDDSRTIRNIQKNVLAQLGHTEILEAGDGQEALDVLKNDKADLMLVDWNMPVMDGITFVRKIREIDKITPIMMCTTEAQKDRVIEAIKAGVNNYVVKPFNVESLAEKIDQTMAKVQAAAEAR